MDVKKYGEVLDSCLGYGAVAVSVTLAKDVGIFDILYQSTVPLTSQEIADKGGLKERYVRELLGALATGGVVDVDSSSTHFHIKPDFKDILKVKSAFLGYIPLFGERFGAIKNCFYKGGPAGNRYSDNPGVFVVLDEIQMRTLKQRLDGFILPSVSGLVQKLESGIDVAEIGMGKGVLLVTLAERYPKSHFTGSDVVDNNIEVTRQRASERGLKNVDCNILDVCKIPEKPGKTFDWIYARDVIHDLPHPETALSGLYRMLKPGGVFSMVEYCQDVGMAEHVNRMDVAYFYTAGVFLCLPESYQDPNSAALGPCWQSETARGMITKAGFKLLGHKRNEEEPNEIVFVCQKPEM